MDFSFTEEQNAIRDTAQRFSRDKLLPFYQEREKTATIDRKVVKEMADLGLIGVELPEEFGGLGQDCVTCGVIVEEMAKGDFNYAYIQIMAGLNGSILCKQAQHEVAMEWIPKIISGESLISIALTEPGHGSDAANIVVSAKKDGDSWVLNGEKTSISIADQSDVAIIFARTGGPGARGISAFLVPMDLPGITRNHFNCMGNKIIGRGSIFMDNVRIPENHLLGKENEGFVTVMQGFDYSRVLLGLQCLSTAQQSVNETWEFIAQREAFGRPIAKFQGVSFPLAEAETTLEAARTLCYKTLWLRDQGLPHTKEAAMCKWWPPKIAHEIIHQCLLTHGHGGYDDSYPHNQRMRDVLGIHIGDGTAQIQKMVIAREVAGRVTVSHAD